MIWPREQEQTVWSRSTKGLLPERAAGLGWVVRRVNRHEKRL
ncbi:MAG: hypothetical protein ACHQQS_03670 [Thermoanaerobaculales bacterium]